MRHEISRGPEPPPADEVGSTLGVGGAGEVGAGEGESVGKGTTVSVGAEVTVGTAALGEGEVDGPALGVATGAPHALKQATMTKTTARPMPSLRTAQL